MGDLKIIYEDNQIIVVEKYPGILSQADGKDPNDLLSEVKKYIKVKYSKPGDVYLGLLHRLDKPVGGVMVFARTTKAAGRLNDQMKKKEIIKEYFAVVNGTPPADEGILEGYIYKDTQTNISALCEKDRDGAKFASLSYETVSQAEGYSLLRVRLMTGRSHQIRVQLAGMGNPVVGDRKYGTDDSHHTAALWAYRISLIHPVTKEIMQFISLPEKIGIWNKFEYGDLMNEC
jgi:23S rRNA pseudouridine1911/1915/1917 synthase